MKQNSNNDVTNEELQNLILELDPPHGLDTPICDVMRMKEQIEKFKKNNDSSSLGFEKKLRQLNNELRELKIRQSELMQKYDHAAKILVDFEPIVINIPNAGSYTFRTYLEGHLPGRERYIVYSSNNGESWYILLRYKSQLGKNLFVLPR